MKSTGLTSVICPVPVSMYCGASVLRLRVIVVDDAPRIYTHDSPANARSVSVRVVVASSKPVAMIDLSVHLEPVRPVLRPASSSQ